MLGIIVLLHLEYGLGHIFLSESNLGPRVQWSNLTRSPAY